MGARCRWLAILLTGLVLGGALPCGSALQQGAPSTGDADAFAAALAQDGFVVQEGKMEVFPIIDLYNMGLLSSCFGNNPSTPYALFFAPPPPGQAAVIDDPNDAATLDGKTLVNYRLRPDEAIVMIGQTPPACSYFSYRSYLYDQYFPAEGERRIVFASLGDTVNRMTIHTSGTPDGQAGSPFGQTTIIVVTADEGIAQRVRAAAEAAGFPASIMNTDVIPSSLVHMGLERNADQFLVILRLAFFEDRQAGQAYMAHIPARVFRVTPSETTTLDPYGVPALRVRGTGDASELNLLGALEELRQAILARYGAAHATELETSVWLYEGYDAIQRGINVIGENRDTTYLRSDDFTLGNDPDEFLIVYGVNHAATGKATYTNFSVFGAAALNGVGAVSNFDFARTAEEYLPGNPAAKYLYVWKVSRSCDGGLGCLTVPWGVKAYGIDLDKPAFVAFRAYLEPATKVGPNWSEIVYDRVVKFGGAN
jgi:hypothetical protein